MTESTSVVTGAVGKRDPLAKGLMGTFWIGRNVLYLDGAGGYTGKYICQNCTLDMHFVAWKLYLDEMIQ